MTQGITRRAFVFICSCFLLFLPWGGVAFADPAPITEQGSYTSCDISWSFDGVDTLTLSGKGAIPASGNGDVTFDGDTMDCWPMPSWLSKVKHLVLQEGITSVGDNAFNGAFPSLESITLPEGLTSIGSYALCGWMDYPDLQQTIVFPSTLVTVGNGAFANLSPGVDPTKSPLKDDYATLQAAGVTNLKDIVGYVPPSSGQLADTDIFWKLEAKDVVDSEGNPQQWVTLTLSGSGELPKGSAGVSLSNATGVLATALKGAVYTSQDVNEVIIDEGITAIGERGFYTSVEPTGVWPKLSKVTIASTVESIGNSAFSGTAIDELVINVNPETGKSSLKTLGQVCFANMTKLETLDLSDTSITDLTLYNSSNVATAFNPFLSGNAVNTALKSLILPDGLEILSGIVGLSGLEELVIPKTVTAFNSKSSLARLPNLKTIIFLGDAPDDFLESMIVNQDNQRHNLDVVVYGDVSDNLRNGLKGYPEINLSMHEHAVAAGVTADLSVANPSFEIVCGDDNCGELFATIELVEAKFSEVDDLNKANEDESIQIIGAYKVVASDAEGTVIDIPEGVMVKVVLVGDVAVLEKDSNGNPVLLALKKAVQDEGKGPEGEEPPDDVDDDPDQPPVKDPEGEELPVNQGPQEPGNGDSKPAVLPQTGDDTAATAALTSIIALGAAATAGVAVRRRKRVCAER